MAKRIILILLPLVLGVTLVVFIYQSVKPGIQSWIISHITKIASEKSPYELEIGSIDWSLFFPSLEIEEIKLRPKTPLFPPVQIGKVSASLDILSLLGGRLNLSTLFIQDPQVDVDIDHFMTDTQSPNLEEIPMKEFFDFIEVLPLGKIAIKNGRFLITSEKQALGLILGSSDILFNFKKNKISAQIDFNNVVVDFDKLGEIPLRVQSDLILTQNTLDISRLNVAMYDSQLRVKGSLPQIGKILTAPQFNAEIELDSHLDRLNHVLSQLSKQMPKISGKISASGSLDYAGINKMAAGIKLNTEGLQVAQFYVGELGLQGQLQKNELSLSKLEIKNDGAKIALQDSRFKFNFQSKDFLESLETQFQSDFIDMQMLMKNFGLGLLPLDAFLKTKGHCSGSVMPDLAINCESSLRGQQLEVRTGSNGKNILLHVNEMSAQGKFNVTAEEIKFSSALTLADDVGSAEGKVNFKQGFQVSFATPRLQTKNIAILAGLNLEGQTALRGSTQGDSHAATFKMDMETQNFYFENFFLGSPRGQLSYKSGELFFDNIDSQFSESSYQGNIKVDLNQGRIAADAEFPRFEVNELLSIFRRIFVSPLPLSGSGSAKVKLEGPFALGKLSYDLSANMIRGSVAGEAFDRFDLILHSNNGQVDVKKVQLTKAKNTILATGRADPTGQLDVAISGKKIPLEESDNISKLGSQISGLLDLEAQLTGFILNPDLRLKGLVSQLVVEEREFQNSSFLINLEDKLLTGQVSLFGKQLLTDFKIPSQPNGPFYLKLQMDRWNYTTLFALIGGGSLLNEYEASLTGSLKLSADSGGLWSSTGSGEFTEFYLQRGSLSLKNNRPLILEMDQGKLSFKQFLLTGDQTFIAIDADKLTRENFVMSLRGQTNLRLLHIFAPFLEELSGAATFTANTSGSLVKPEVLGQASIRNGFAKIKGFPHGFEKIVSDVQFSQSKIFINSFNGDLAGGTFTGDGKVSLDGPQNIPTDFRAKFSKVNLNLPDRVRTSGDGEIVFRGNWFPFTVAGIYNVSSGFVDKELDSEGGNFHLKQSSYLPKIILKGAFEPILLDLNINIASPLVIKNSLVDGAVTGVIQVKGSPTSPALGGQLVAEKGTKALFKEKVFEVQNASVKFTGETEINPELFVSARSRIAEYDVTMLIQGPAKEPNIKMSSIPSLSEADLRTLVVMGVTSQSLEKSTGTVTSEKVNKGIAAGLLTQFQPVKQLQKTTGVEIQIYATDDTKSGSVQKVTLSKKLSDKVKASATQSTGSKSQSNEYTIQYDFTEGLSAVGRYEDRKYLENGGGLDSTNKTDENIMGLDLEYKKEFK